MPLAFLVEQIGAVCLADLWRIELRCDLPCKPFRLYPDAPLAYLIGTQAKQGWDKGETSLGSPPNSASWRVRFRFAAGELRADGDVAPTYQRRDAFVTPAPLHEPKLTQNWDLDRAERGKLDRTGIATLPRNDRKQSVMLAARIPDGIRPSPQSIPRCRDRDYPSTNHPTLLGRTSKLKPEGALNAENF